MLYHYLDISGWCSSFRAGSSRITGISISTLIGSHLSSWNCAFCGHQIRRNEDIFSSCRLCKWYPLLPGEFRIFKQSTIYCRRIICHPEDSPDALFSMPEVMESSISCYLPQVRVWGCCWREVLWHFQGSIDKISKKWAFRECFVFQCSRDDRYCVHSSESLAIFWEWS